MDKKKLIALLGERKVQDYSFNVLFFLIFSFFLVFAIRPNIITVFTLQQQYQDLRLKNKESEAVIMQIVNYQSLLESYRDKLSLLDEAIPSTPGIAKAVEDVRVTASDSGMIISDLSVEEIVFHDQKGSGTLQTYNITLGSQGTVEQLNTFLMRVVKQRRLKTIEEMGISASPTGETILNFIIKTYYL